MQTYRLLGFLYGVLVAMSVLIVPTLLFIMLGGGKWDANAIRTVAVEIAICVIAGWIGLAIAIDTHRH